jgi:hypothetical protein
MECTLLKRIRIKANSFLILRASLAPILEFMKKKNLFKKVLF